MDDPLPHPRPPAQITDGQDDQLAGALLSVVRQLAAEMHPGRAPRPIGLDSSLERDAGLDSLGRAELLARVERAFGVRLPETVLATAETPGDLLVAVMAVQGAAPPPERLDIAAPLEPIAESLPEDAMTLAEVLHWHLERHEQRIHLQLYDAHGNLDSMTYRQLWDEACAVAAGLQLRAIGAKQSVAIMLPTTPEFFISFFGVLLAGAVPVPIYPPARPSQIEEHVRRQARILTNAQARMLITSDEAKAAARLVASQVDTELGVSTAAELTAGPAQPAMPVLATGDTALLQYTSGSTGSPKGVVLTHANLLANIRAMGRAVEATSADVFVSWLPLYHDMGLIGAWLGSLYHASLFVVMSPLTFLARPKTWLWAIHRHRGTLSAAPNFGYEFCVSRIPDQDLEGLDLGSWRRAFNGAEPVSPATLERFAERFSRYGLRREALAPVYGLAECSVGLSFPPVGRGPLVDVIQRGPFVARGQALPASDDDADVLRFVACGQPLPGHEIRIVDAAGRELGERREGRLEFRGPSATVGYFRNPQATTGLFRGEWLDSGDLAYIAGADVYLTGRAKDIIIRAGRNIYPHEVEEAVGDIAAVRKGCVAVFAAEDRASGTERLVIMAETREQDPEQRERLRERIHEVASDLIGIPPDDIVLAPPHTVLKTSSGKIRRAASREVYESGARGPRALWWQVLRLGWAGLRPRWRRVLRALADGLYALWAWAVFWLLTPVVWIAVALLGRPDRGQPVVRAAARLATKLLHIPLRVEGLEHLPPSGPYVMVANHASYLDGAVLAAALPVHFGFVAKKELEGQWVPRVFLRGIGAQFVERFDARRGVEDTARVQEAIGQGRAVLFFPEGTFLRVPGLLPFRMGAFVTASRLGAPIIPVAIRGTRSMLRSGQWLPHHGPLEVRVGAPLLPEGEDWAAVVRLRDRARAALAEASGEPELQSTVGTGPADGDQTSCA